MPSPTRYPNGVTNATPNGAMESLVIPTPQNPFVFFDDFRDYTAADWFLTANLTGAITSFRGGAIKLTTTDTALPLSFTSTASQFEFEKGKQTWFEMRIFATDITDLDSSEFIFGIGNTTSTNTVEIFFDIAVPGLVGRAIESAGSTSETVILTNQASLFPTANTPQILSFHYDGVDTLKFYVDNREAGTLSSASIPFSAGLVPIKATIDGVTSNIRAIDMDYIMGAQER